MNKSWFPSLRAKNIIISEETLIHIQPEFYDIFKNDFEIKVIVYIRKPAELMVSEYNQMLKIGFYSDVNKYMDLFEQSTYEKVINQIKYFGNENFIIRPFEKSQWKNNNLIDDFLSSIGIDTDKIGDKYEITENTNEGFTKQEAEIIRLNNAIGNVKQKRNNYKQMLLKSYDYKQNGIKSAEALNDEEILKITERFIPQIKQIEELSGKKLFQNYFPEYYGKERKFFEGINLTETGLDILHKAIKSKSDEIEDLKKTLDKKTLFSDRKSVV